MEKGLKGYRPLLLLLLCGGMTLKAAAQVCGGGAQRTEPGEVPRLPDRRGDMG